MAETGDPQLKPCSELAWRNFINLRPAQPLFLVFGLKITKVSKRIHTNHYHPPLQTLVTRSWENITISASKIAPGELYMVYMYWSFTQGDTAMIRTGNVIRSNVNPIIDWESFNMNSPILWLCMVLKSHDISHRRIHIDSKDYKSVQTRGCRHTYWQQVQLFSLPKDHATCVMISTRINT